jgi:hypothetical protein
MLTVKPTEVKLVTNSKVVSSKPITKCVVSLEAVLISDTLTLTCKPKPYTYYCKYLINLFNSSLVNTFTLSAVLLQDPYPT